MSDAPARSANIQILDEQGRVGFDLPCSKCGYNLRTIHLDTQCPECGTAILRSISGPMIEIRTSGEIESLLPCAECNASLLGLSIRGNCPACGTPVARSACRAFLQLSPAQWLHRVAGGVFGMLVASSLLLALPLSWIIVSMSRTGFNPIVSIIAGFAPFLGWISALLGILRTTRPEPGLPRRQIRFTTRYWIRMLVIVHLLTLIGGIAAMIWSAVEETEPSVIAVSVMTCGLPATLIAAWVMTFFHLGTLMRRAQRDKLAQYLTVQGVFLIIGGVLALVATVVLFLGMWFTFAAIATAGPVASSTPAPQPGVVAAAPGDPNAAAATASAPASAAASGPNVPAGALGGAAPVVMLVAGLASIGGLCVNTILLITGMILLVKVRRELRTTARFAEATRVE